MAPLRCPDCAVALQVLFVPRPDGQPDVQVDRCPACLGLWFEVGELEPAVAKLVPTDRLGAPTTRRCPTCTTTMETVLLPGAVPAETCASCRGVWLDVGELKELGGVEPGAPINRRAAPVEAEAARPAPAAPRAGFACAGCGKKTPFTDAHGTAKGLVCGGCSPQVQTMPVPLQVTVNHGPGLITPPNDGRRGGINLAEVIRYFFS